jgi:hypothetical protein
MLVASATPSPRAGRFWTCSGIVNEPAYSVTPAEPAEEEMLRECSTERSATDHDDVEWPRVEPRIISSNVGPRVGIGAGYGLGKGVAHVTPGHVATEVGVLREHIVTA